MNSHGWVRTLAATGAALTLSASAFAGGSQGNQNGAANGQQRSSNQQERANAPSKPATGQSDAASNSSSATHGQTASAATHSAKVEAAQRKLASRGLYSGQIDGILGEKTRSALKDFQSNQGIPQTGSLDARTSRALGIGSERVPVSGETGSNAQGTNDKPAMEQQIGGRSQRVQLSSLSKEQVRQLQQKLQQYGVFQGNVNGVMGADTKQALSRYFQQQAHLANQGMLTQTSLDALGVPANGGESTNGRENTSGRMEPRGNMKPTHGAKPNGGATTSPHQSTSGIENTGGAGPR